MNTKTQDALLRLARDNKDGLAAVTLYEENKKVLGKAMARWLGHSGNPEDVGINLLVRIAQRARYFLPELEDPTEWVSSCADLECRRLRDEMEEAAEN
jgi:hypothetical protein